MSFVINGRRRLCGDIHIHGAKNSVLPIMAATLMCNSKSVLHNCPRLSDTDDMLKILSCFGCKVKLEGDAVEIDPTSANAICPDRQIMQTMRSSVLLLGAMLTKFRTANVYYPGGCKLGPRPLDIHMDALRSMGISISQQQEMYICNGKPQGSEITLRFPSVGATENILLAAVCADGSTIINNAAREPEIIDLACFLNKCGAKIYGAGEKKILIEGVPYLMGAEHTCIPDRIEAVTYMCAAAATGGNLRLCGVKNEHLRAICEKLSLCGCGITAYDNEMVISAYKRPCSPLSVQTGVYPQFPTDALPPFMAVCSVAKGVTAFNETIFEKRYRHAEQLCKMGAMISVNGQSAICCGVESLHGANVCATDLRGGAALVIAALCAEGTTVISCTHHIDRGYEGIEQSLSSVGVDIVRE